MLLKHIFIYIVLIISYGYTCNGEFILKVDKTLLNFIALYPMSHHFYKRHVGTSQ